MDEKDKLALIRNVIRWYSPINTQVKVNCVLEYLSRSVAVIDKLQEKELLNSIPDTVLREFLIKQFSFYSIKVIGHDVKKSKTESQSLPRKNKSIGTVTAINKTKISYSVPLFKKRSSIDSKWKIVDKTSAQYISLRACAAKLKSSDKSFIPNFQTRAMVDNYFENNIMYLSESRVISNIEHVRYGDYVLKSYIIHRFSLLLTELQAKKSLKKIKKVKTEFVRIIYTPSGGQNKK